MSNEILTLEYLAPYLPYQLKLKGNDGIYTLIGINRPYKTNDKTFLTGQVRFEKTTKSISHIFNLGQEKDHLIPILRPLSDLTKEIEHNGKKFVPMDIICPPSHYKSEKERDFAVSCFLLKIEALGLELISYPICQKLIEWHFDVFGLIEKGLAVSINNI